MSAVAAIAAGAVAWGCGGLAEAHDVKPQAPVFTGRAPSADASPEANRLAAAIAARPTYPADQATSAVWWIVMNNPGFCGGICGLDDLAVADVGAVLFHAAGLGPVDGAEAYPVPPLAAGERVPAESGDACVVDECTPLQTVTFYPQE